MKLTNVQIARAKLVRLTRQKLRLAEFKPVERHDCDGEYEWDDDDDTEIETDDPDELLERLEHPQSEYDWLLREIEEAKVEYERLLTQPVIETPFESIIEAELHRPLRAATWPLHLAVQYWIAGLRVDFAFPEFKLAIECDGKEFHSWPHEIKWDRRRDEILAEEGWNVVRFSGREIMRNPERCAERSVERLISLGAQLR